MIMVEAGERPFQGLRSDVGLKWTLASSQGSGLWDSLDRHRPAEVWAQVPTGQLSSRSWILLPPEEPGGPTVH